MFYRSFCANISEKTYKKAKKVLDKVRTSAYIKSKKTNKKEMKMNFYKEKIKKIKSLLSEEELNISLPTLAGSEKQNSWASEIREDKVIELQYLARNCELNIEKMPERKEQIERMLLLINEFINNDSASWWISNKDEDITQILQSAFLKREEK